MVSRMVHALMHAGAPGCRAACGPSRSGINAGALRLGNNTLTPNPTPIPNPDPAHPDAGRRAARLQHLQDLGTRESKPYPNLNPNAKP